MAMSHANNSTTGTTAMMVSCQTDSAMFGYIGLPFFRIGQPVTHRHDPLDVPGFGHDVASPDRAFRVALERDDAVGDGDGEVLRIGQEFASDHGLGDFLPDFGIRAAVDAQHVGPADDPDQLASFSDHRKALDPAVIHEAGG